MKTVLLFSGGFDSFLHYFLLKPDILLYMDSGAPYTKAELQHIRKKKSLLKNSKLIVDDTISLSHVENKHNMIVPFRNMYYILHALQYGQHVYLGANDSDRKTPDKSAEFFTHVNDFVSLLIRKDFWKDYCPISWDSAEFKIEAPFIDKTKSEVVRLCLEKGVATTKDIQSIRSCYNDSPLGCGCCSPCAEKAVALLMNGIFDKKLFDEDPSEMIRLQYANHLKYRPEVKTTEEFNYVIRNLL